MSNSRCRILAASSKFFALLPNVRALFLPRSVKSTPPLHPSSARFVDLQQSISLLTFLSPSYCRSSFHSFDCERMPHQAAPKPNSKGRACHVSSPFGPTQSFDSIPVLHAHMLLSALGAVWEAVLRRRTLLPKCLLQRVLHDLDPVVCLVLCLLQSRVLLIQLQTMH